MFGRVFIVVLLDGDVASTDAHHTIIAFDRHLFHLGANLVHILLLELDDGHEDAQKLRKRLQVQLVELIYREFIFVFIHILEVFVDNILRLLHLAREFINEN